MDFRKLDRTWIIAEIGVNHEGNLNLAEDMIFQAAEAGADAVKFATFRIEHYISTVQPERRAKIAKFELAPDDFRRLAKVAMRCGVTFFSTPLDPGSVDVLDGIQPLFKIASGDLNNTTFIRYVLGKGKPTIISTGYGGEVDVRRTVDAILETRPDARENGSVMLMHCVGAYPTAPVDLNLRNMQWLKDTFGLPVGFSDHTIGIKACELAVAMGAKAVETHFTYRKEGQAWHDHAVSVDPKDMKSLVNSVRDVEIFLGRYERGADHNPAEDRLTDMRRSPGALTDIPAGTPIKEEWLTWLRPAWGLAADELNSLVGKRLYRDVPAGDLIRPEDLMDNSE